MSGYVPVDALAAAASYVRHEFGEYGYSVRVLAGGFTVSAFELLCGVDGGRRVFAVDRYGNIELGPDGLEGMHDWSDWFYGACESLSERRNGCKPRVIEI